jgi:predicted ATP-grasp superfamily ATP-dependent carboligase
MTAKGMFGMSVPTTLTVLVHEWVTGGGLAGSPLPDSWAAEGRAMRRAIAGEFARLEGGRTRVVVTLDARLPDDPGPWAVARIGQGEHAERVRALARAADFTVLVAPETRGILARLTRDLNHVGARLLGSSAGAVELAGDKARLAALLESRGIDTPPVRSVIPSLGLPADAEYPAVLKPVDGAGSVDTFYLPDAESLPEEARMLPAALLQTFVPGVPMSASFLVGDGRGPRLIGVGVQRMVVREGRFEYRGGTIPAPGRGALPQLQPAVKAVGGLRGFVGVDFIWDTERRHAMILEINPRPTTSCVGLCRLLPPGRLARAWLDACEPSAGYCELLDGLAQLVHGQRRLSFDSTGEFISEDLGVFV